MENKTSLKIKTCLISVFEKKYILEFAQNLKANGIEIISTGGTAFSLRKNGIEVTSVESLTSFPEMLDGRVKTLHPNIHGGLLAQRNNKNHMETLRKYKINAIDMVVINLYPFKEKRGNCSSKDEIIEAIDIGGSTLMRAAAKNYQDIVVVSDPADYPVISEAINNSEVFLDLRASLALKAFKFSANYENQIALFFEEINEKNTKRVKNNKESDNLMMPYISLNLKKYSDLRYGENPHQKAAIYYDSSEKKSGLICCGQIQGKKLSYNNLVDADSAFQCVEMFKNSACVIVKHANPCGVAEAESCIEAFKRAKQTDSISSFGGIIAFNKVVDENLAKYVCQDFIELVIAPDFTANAIKTLSYKPNVRVIKNPKKNLDYNSSSLDIKSLTGGYLIQDSDNQPSENTNFNVVTIAKPNLRDLDNLKFAWIVANWVKSNAIVFCRDFCTLGIGAGQMSRFDSVKIAKMKALEAGYSLENSVVASDAFFPFRDGVDILAEAGAKSVVQPGGSIKDKEVISAANEHGIAMVFTGMRHFRH
jgi:phosphoribosylaminoimidazolecarboxamide formyltransferase/IMP cyclohydrolase